MRLLLDTNVLVAAFVARGHCTDLLERAVQAHRLISSRPLLEELRTVLGGKLRQHDSDVRQTLRWCEATFMLVEPETLGSQVCRDRGDDLVLATALAGNCRVIVTGDQDLLVLDPFGAIRILAPAAFWPWEAGGEPPPKR